MLSKPNNSQSHHQRLFLESLNSQIEDLQPISPISRPLTPAGNESLKFSSSRSLNLFEYEEGGLNADHCQMDFFDSILRGTFEPQLRNQGEIWDADLHDQLDQVLEKLSRESKDDSMMLSSLEESILSSHSEHDETIKFGLSEVTVKRIQKYDGLTQRKDVVLKNLLRRIKTFFWKDFKSETRYLKLKRYRRVGYFENCIKLYMQNCLQVQLSNEDIFVFGGFVSSKDMKELISRKFKIKAFNENNKKEYLTRIDEIYSTLSNFSVSKFSLLARNKLIYSLIIEFFNRKQDDLNEDESIGIQILLNECRKADNNQSSFYQ